MARHETGLGGVSYVIGDNGRTHGVSNSNTASRPIDGDVRSEYNTETGMFDLVDESGSVVGHETQADRDFEQSRIYRDSPFK